MISVIPVVLSPLMRTAFLLAVLAFGLTVFLVVSSAPGWMCAFAGGGFVVLSHAFARARDEVACTLAMLGVLDPPLLAWLVGPLTGDPPAVAGPSVGIQRSDGELSDHGFDLRARAKRIARRLPRTWACVLRLLEEGPAHGLDLVRGSDGVLRRGIVYHHLSNMVELGLLESEPMAGRLVYRLLPLGRALLMARGER